MIGITKYVSIMLDHKNYSQLDDYEIRNNINQKLECFIKDVENKINNIKRKQKLNKLVND